MLLLDNTFWPILPDPGLFIWTTVIFLLFWWLVGRSAFKPIQAALKKRETDISDALSQAEKAREEMANLKAKNEDLLVQAREERAMMLKEAKEIQERIISEAKAKADAEYRKKVESAMQEIKNREMEMLINVKNESGKMALDIAEKLLHKELKGQSEHEAFVEKLVNDIKLN